MNFLDRISGLTAEWLGRAPGEAFAFARRIAEVPGFVDGSTGTAAEQRPAILLLLAMSSHLDAKRAAALSTSLYGLPFYGASRSFSRDGERASFPLGPVDPLAGSTFGDFLSAMVMSLRLGIPAEMYQHDPRVRVTGFTVSLAGGLWGGAVERASSEPNEDGHAVNDIFSYLSAPDGGLDVETPHVVRSTFVPVAVLEALAAALGPIRGTGGGCLGITPANEELSEHYALEIAAAPAGLMGSLDA